MTTTALSAGTSIRTGRVTQARVARSEWTKFRSLRSTRYTLLAGIGATIVFAIIPALINANRWSTMSLQDKLTFNPLETTLIGVGVAQLAIGVLGVLVITGEYSTGMIRATFTAVPKRLPVLWAKAGVFGAITLILSVPAMFIAFFSAQAILSGHTLFGRDISLSISDPGVARVVVGGALYLTLVGLFGLGLGAILRNTAGGIGAFAAILFVIPPVLNAAAVELERRDLARTSPATPGRRSCSSDVLATRSARGPASACSPATPPLRSPSQPFCSGDATSRTRALKLVGVASVVIALAGCGGSKSHTIDDVHDCERSPRPVGNHLAVPPRPRGQSRVPPTWRQPPSRATAQRTPSLLPRASNPKVDCFYVYPTVSDQSTINANLAIGLRQAEIAIAQASRFSQVCRVYAPVYRQITLSALNHPARITLADALIAYNSVLAAFRDYLAHYNHGRGIVFIGHSQGASILIKLLKDQVDAKPAMRRHVGLGTPARRQRHRPQGSQHRRRLQPHPALQLEHADRLRRRLLELHDQATLEQPVRPDDLGCRREPPRPAQHLAQHRDRVREPRLSRRRTGTARPVRSIALPPVPRRRCRAAGEDALGLVPGRIHGRAASPPATQPGSRSATRSGSPDQRPLLGRTGRPRTRPAHPRRQHRARQPRPTRPRRGRRLPRLISNVFDGSRRREADARIGQFLLIDPQLLPRIGRVGVGFYANRSLWGEPAIS